MAPRTSTRRHRSFPVRELVRTADPRRSHRPHPARIAGAVVAVALLTSLGACSDDEPETGADPTVEAEIGDAATIESSTTATETTVADTTPAPPAGAPDPEAAAASLYGAWKAGDRTAAATVAEPVAVEAVFAAAPGDYALYNRCNTGEFGASACLYRGDQGTIQFSMTQREAAWVVTMAVFSPA